MNFTLNIYFKKFGSSHCKCSKISEYFVYNYVTFNISSSKSYTISVRKVKMN